MYHKYSQSIEEIKNDETKKEYVDELVEMKKKIISSMKVLTNDYQECLDNYKFKNVEYDKSVNKMIYTKIKYVYWENIRNYIFNDKKTDVYYSVINDYKTILNDIKVVIDLTAIDLLEGYEIDIDNLIDASASLAKTLINTNKMIDSENYDEIYDMLCDRINNDPKYLIDGFKICFDRLEFIKKVKQNLKEKEE